MGASHEPRRAAHAELEPRIKNQGNRAPRIGLRQIGLLVIGLQAIAVVLLGCAARPAAAHPQFALSTVNRYARLVLRPGEARLFYTLMIGDVPAAVLRQQADRSRDGTLDAAEQATLATALGERVRDGISLARAGAPIPLRWEPATLKLDKPAVASIGFPLELVASFPLDLTDPVELRFEDRVEITPVGDIELRLEEAPGVQVESTYEGQSPPAPPAAPTTPAPNERRLLFQSFGPPRSSLSDRSVHLRVARLVPREPAQSTAATAATRSTRYKRRALPGAAAAGLLIVVITILVRRRRRGLRPSA